MSFFDDSNNNNNRGTYEFDGGAVLLPSGMGIVKTLSTTTNDELYKICNKLKLNLVGIFMSNQILDYMKNGLPNGNYILNLENSNQQGSHWVGMVKYANTIYYNDSFGVYPDSSVYMLIQKHKYKLYMNKRNNQHITASSCGYWAIYFIYVMNKGNGKTLMDRFKNFNNQFVEDTKWNEKELVKKFNLLLK